MHRSQVLGAAIRHMRQMALDGAPFEEIEAFVKSRSPEVRGFLSPELDRAFLQRKMFMFNAAFNAKWIEAHCAEWEHDPVAELMRLRDYFSFMQFAQQERVIVTVCSANPAAGPWIGQPEVRCYSGALPVVSRRTAPNEGLLAADPADPRLIEMLNAYETPMPYSAYLGQLEAQGLRVADADSGRVIEDALGFRYHEAYRLHGVYDAKTEEPAWTPQRGERLRAALNRHLGTRLVHCGPHDDWALRNERSIAGPFFGPQTPVLVFDHDQYIRERRSQRDLARDHRFRWDTLYPHHPIAERPRRDHG